MRKLQCITATAAAVSALSTFAGTLAQTPSPQHSGKPSATQRKPAGIHILSGAAADNVVLESTGKPVDKAAIKAREEREAAADQTVSEGEAYLKAGNIQAAIISYKAALDISPTDGLAYRRLAEAYSTTGKADEASRAFHKFLVEGFGPGNGNGGVGDTADEWAEYALVLVKTGQSAEAIRCYNHAASLLDFEGSKDNGGKPALKVLFPEIVLGDALPEQVEYTPERLQALADTALAHEEMGFGSNKETIAHMKEASKLYPDSAAVQYYLGEALSRSYYVFLDSSPKDKAATWAAYQEDKKATAVAYKKAAELGNDATIAAAKERLGASR